jgi:hypothetical protein
MSQHMVATSCALRGGQHRISSLSTIMQYLFQKQVFHYPSRLSSCVPVFFPQHTFNLRLEMHIKLLKLILHRNKVHQQIIEPEILLPVCERRAARRDLAGGSKPKVCSPTKTYMTSTLHLSLLGVFSYSLMRKVALAWF